MAIREELETFDDGPHCQSASGHVSGDSALQSALHENSDDGGRLCNGAYVCGARELAVVMP